MAGNDNETKMVSDAVAGDRQALEGLLLTYHDRLETRVKRKLPAQFRGLLMAEDVLQETYVEAFRRIATFLPEGRDAFYRWLATIAEHRMLDLIKGLRAAKRGGGRRARDNFARQPAGSPASARA